MAEGFGAYDAAKSAAIGGLRGTVLEIGAGRGRNFGRLHPDVTWIGCEPDRRRRTELARTAHGFGHTREPLASAAESVPLPDASVDAVLATVVLCSVRDQARVLAEIARLLRPGGEFVFAEHVGAPERTWKRALQRVIAPATRLLDHGCDPSRETELSLRRSPLDLVQVEHFDLPALGAITVPYVVGRALRT
ncbi:class I SAM-dependent methyltransferase [Polymorphospora sp. NPDC051019]|uniref:class I SAM-dependent methyltransferase n=1 Tax=Polymorphospora sp. NPDC051019 TaxID=3155725 RepID=UPI00343CEA25